MTSGLQLESIQGFIFIKSKKNYTQFRPENKEINSFYIKESQIPRRHVTVNGILE